MKRSAAPRKPAASLQARSGRPADADLAARPAVANPFLDAGLGGSKLCRPECRADTVPRRRLVASLLRETAPVIVIAAPSGAGKTLAVSQWLEAEQRPTAWLHLDHGDNDPVTLLQYLARSLEAVAPVPPAVHSWLRLPQPPVAEAVVPALVFAVAAASPFVLVLDDVQCVRDERSWAATWPVMASLPDGSAAVLCGRAEPPLPLARLRAEARLAEFGFAQLSFDRDEVAELFRLRGTEAPPELIADLLETTEGWAAGAYLAVVGMRRCDGTDAAMTPASTAHEVEGYIASEVLAGQPPEVVDFLVRTSILERLSPDLCDALMGRSDSAAALERVERENLFVIALDRERGWYRYHRLFSAALRAELLRRAPGEVPELHRRAAAWFQQRDQVRHAVRHWLAAGDLPEAGDLVATRWLGRYNGGRLFAARLWLDQFAPGQEAAYPPLTIAAAWIRALTGDATTACRRLGRLDSAMLDGPSPDGTASLRSSVAMLDALLGSSGPAEMREQAERALDLEREHGRLSVWLDFATNLAGVARALSGDVGRAIEALEAAARRGLAIRSSIEFAALGHLSLLAGDEGRWEDAESYALEAVDKAADYDIEDYLPSVPARIARDRLSARAGDRGDAAADLEELLEGLDPQFCPWLGPQIALILAEVAADAGDAAGARRWLAEARRWLVRWAAPALVRRREKLASRLDRTVLAEPVSAAEMRVLELLPTYLTLTEIAARLTVSTNTVGSHVRSLHRKLGATSRSGTVKRAVELGLLDPRSMSPDD